MREEGRDEDLGFLSVKREDVCEADSRSFSWFSFPLKVSFSLVNIQISFLPLE